jgi:hypothetical protein
LLLIELFYFGYDHAAQTDPSLYFPKLEIFDRIAEGPDGRIIGFGCLPANLAQAAGLADIRGYDGIDPSRIVQLLAAARNPKSPVLSYAATQLMSPMMFSDSQTREPRVPPILDMLNVRYVIFRGAPPAGVRALYTDSDYWVYFNERALPRAFVPRQTQVIPDTESRLQAMSMKTFDPRETAYLEQSVDLPQPISGSVEFLEDSPQLVTLSAKMETPGVVILADRWDRGWRAYVNEAEVPILRVNHALRGVRVDTGESTIRFAYEPATLYRGLAISVIGGIGSLAWIAIVVVTGSRQPVQPAHAIQPLAARATASNPQRPVTAHAPGRMAPRKKRKGDK